MEHEDKKTKSERVEKIEGKTEKGEKKHKKRQKKILADLKKQIEFYFSEPNLQKDRFLRQRIAEHPQGCVEIATIASFNKMTQLCNDIALVVKAMKMCPSVEVVDDKWVKPSKSLPEPKNVDSVTIYVEKLPPHADHDWIKSLFSSCGNVVYVSLPRYKSTRDIKGFAFVEFETESEAQQALEMFNQDRKHDKEVDSDKERNEEVISDTNEKQGKKNKKCKQKLGESENEKGKRKKAKHKIEESSDLTSDGSSTCVHSENDYTPRHKKKRRNLDEDGGDDPRVKLEKNDEMKNEPSKSDCNSISTSGKRKRKEIDLADMMEEDSTSSKNVKQSEDKDSEDVEGELDEIEKKHKKRKRKKKEKEKKELPDLKLMSKLEWLRLKKEYQKLQRQVMKETKSNLKKNEKHWENRDKRISEKAVNTVQAESVEKTKGKPELPAKLEMQPGVVLKYLTKINIEKRVIRDMFLSVAPVSYLEKKDEEEMGFVRFASKEGCQKVVEAVKNGSLENIEIKELTEKEDKEYWEKLNSDRLERFQHKKRKKQRGTQKIVNKIEAQAKKRDHIHFDE